MRYADFKDKSEAEAFLAERKNAGFKGYVLEYNSYCFQVRTWK